MTIKGSVMSLALLAAVVAPVALSANEAEAQCRGGCHFVRVCVRPGHYVTRTVVVAEIRFDPCGNAYIVHVPRVVRTWVPPRYVWRCIRCGRLGSSILGRRL